MASLTTREVAIPKPKAFQFSAYSKDFTQSLQYDDDFSPALDNLFEKSGGTREKALRDIAGLLQSFIVPTWSLESGQVTLAEGIKKAVRGGTTERCLACRTAVLFAICLGTESDEFVSEVQSAIEGSIGSASDPLAQAEAIQAVAFLNFISGDTSDSLELLNKMVGWCEGGVGQVQSAVAHSVSLCCSSIPAATVATDVIPHLARPIATLVSPSAEHAVRIAAAQTICLLVEHSQEHQVDEGEDFDIFELDGYFDVTQFMEDLQDVSTAATKQERKDAEDFLGQLQESLETGICPFRESLVIKQTEAEYEDWCSLVQIEWFRDYLQSGFLPHLSENELMHQIFELDPSTFSNRAQKLSQEEKRAYKSKNSATSKQRTLDRRRQQRSNNFGPE